MGAGPGSSEPSEARCRSVRLTSPDRSFMVISETRSRSPVPSSGRYDTTVAGIPSAARSSFGAGPVPLFGSAMSERRSFAEAMT